MADLTVFSFQPGSSRVHLLDARVKLVCTALVTLAGVAADPGALVALSGGLVIMMRHARLSVKRLARELRLILFFLAIVLVSRALTTPGHPLVAVGDAMITREGIVDGVLICWRLTLVIVLGSLLTATTRPSAIRAAVHWFLHPLPLISGRRAATMMGLLLRFIPVIFEQAAETRDAQRCRGVNLRKNPVYRLKVFAVPMIRRTFEHADNLALAMAARGYRDDRTEPDLTVTRADWAAFVGVLCLCLPAFVSI